MVIANMQNKLYTIQFFSLANDQLHSPQAATAEPAGFSELMNYTDFTKLVNFAELAKLMGKDQTHGKV